MPVMSNALVTNAGRIAASDDATVANIAAGAQYGYGNQLVYIDAATPLVLRPLVAVITHMPSMFSTVPGMPEAMKALIECHATRIEGVDVQYTLEGSELPAGQDGQNEMMPTNARRAAVNPSITMPELNGNLVWNIHRRWLTMIKDPDTQASSLAGYVSSSTAMKPHVWSEFAMDVCFIQYDTTMRPENIIDAYFITNMWPNDIGAAGYTKAVGESTRPDRTIQYYGVLQHNENTFQAGRDIASLLKLHEIDYNFAPPVATDIESAIQQEGLQAQAAAALGGEFTPMGANSALV